MDSLGLLGPHRRGIAFCSENTQYETKNNFTSLRETMNIPVPFIWESLLQQGYKYSAMFKHSLVPSVFFNHASFHFSACRYPCINRELTQQNGWKTRDGRMTKKCLVILGMHSLAWHFFVMTLTRACSISWLQWRIRRFVGFLISREMMTTYWHFYVGIHSFYYERWVCKLLGCLTRRWRTANSDT